MTNWELPPGKKWRQYELHGLGFRDFARVQPSASLDPFRLAKFANLVVIDFDQIKGLNAKNRAHLLGSASEEWSGGACSRPLPDGRRIVILNPNHGRMRTHATLMEEISHVFLGHQPTKLKIIGENTQGRTISRDYRKADEDAAYGTGAGIRAFAARATVPPPGTLGTRFRNRSFRAISRPGVPGPPMNL
jgi:hypothetical protein